MKLVVLLQVLFLCSTAVHGGNVPERKTNECIQLGDASDPDNLPALKIGTSDALFVGPEVTVIDGNETGAESEGTDRFTWSKWKASLGGTATNNLVSFVVKKWYSSNQVRNTDFMEVSTVNTTPRYFVYKVITDVDLGDGEIETWQYWYLGGKDNQACQILYQKEAAPTSVIVQEIKLKTP